MLAKEIRSLQHPIVKTFVKLRASKRARYALRKIPLMGIKLVEEAEKIDVLLTTRRYRRQILSQEHYLVTEDILKKVSGQGNPEPVAALVSMPHFENLQEKRFLVALDGVRDPGNVGMLMRTAYGLGIEGMFLSQKCADPFNDKVVRSSMGAVLRLPIYSGSRGDLIELAEKFDPLVADITGPPLEEIGPVDRPLLILGSESQGVCTEFKEAFPKVSIPICHIDSLNVGAAGAILMYYFIYARSAF